MKRKKEEGGMSGRMTDEEKEGGKGRKEGMDG